MNVQVDPSEDTEWNDILRSKGIIPEKPPSPTAELEAAFEEAVQRAHENRLEDKTLDELDELDEDGLEDEEFIELYRKKRMAEIKEMASKEKFGHVYRISKPEYKEEITDASENDAYVFVHLSYPSVTQSKLLAGLFDRVAEKFRDIKFVDIDARQINERYPVENCPTILVYKNTNVVKQLITLSTVGGNSTNLKDIEQFLVTVGAVKPTDRRLAANEEDSDLDDSTRRRLVFGSRESVDSDSDFDD